MINLITGTAQSLHDKWCEQMREKGRHGPDGLGHDFICDATLIPCGKLVLVRPEERRYCYRFHADLIPWPDLPESRRQEYLATAKAVLPEIVGEVLKEAVRACERVSSDPPVGDATEADGFMGGCHECEDEILKLRDRRLKELK